MTKKETVIKVENIGKKYIIGKKKEPYLTLVDLMVNFAKLPYRMLKGEVSFKNSEFWALRNVSFEVKRGEVVGIIGRNGAGKSTLLKILSRITEPTEGKITIHGRVSSLLEVGTGFHPELTGRENIYLNGAILGMTKKEINEKFNDIVDFAEIEKFIDTPVKRYSSGMYVRLAFAVAAHVEPDILLVDEVLAVGDAEFQKKCLGKMKDVAAGGRTVLFVSHNISSVKALCSSAMLLYMGQKIYSGSVYKVVDFYLRTFVNKGHVGKIARHMHASGTGELLIEEVILKDSTGQPVSQVGINEPFSITIVFSVTQPLKGVRIGLGFNTHTGIRITTVHHTDGGLEPFQGDIGVYEISFSLSNPLLPNTYIISVGAHSTLGGTHHPIDHVPEAIMFDVVEHFTDKYMHQTYNPGVTRFTGEWKSARRIR